jgi:hypothetical protein
LRERSRAENTSKKDQRKPHPSNLADYGAGLQAISAYRSAYWGNIEVVILNAVKDLCISLAAAPDFYAATKGIHGFLSDVSE